MIFGGFGLLKAFELSAQSQPFSTSMLFGADK